MKGRDLEATLSVRGARAHLSVLPEAESCAVRPRVTEVTTSMVPRAVNGPLCGRAHASFCQLREKRGELMLWGRARARRSKTAPGRHDCPFPHITGELKGAPWKASARGQRTERFREPAACRR